MKTVRWNLVKISLRDLPSSMRAHPRLTMIALGIFLVCITAVLWLVFAAEHGYFTPTIGKPYGVKVGNVTEDTTSLYAKMDVCNPNGVNISASIEGTLSYNNITMGRMDIFGDTTIYARNMTTLTLALTLENGKLFDFLTWHVEHDESSSVTVDADIGLVLKYKLPIEGTKRRVLNVTTKTCTMDITSSLRKTIDDYLSSVAFDILGIPLVIITSSDSHWLAPSENVIVLKSDITASYCRFIPVFEGGTIRADTISIATFAVDKHFPPLHRKHITIPLLTQVKSEGLLKWWTARKDPTGPINLSVELQWHSPFGKERSRIITHNITSDFSDMFQFQKCKYEDGDSGEVTNRDELISLTSVLWAFYFVVVIAVCIRKRMKK